MKKGLIGMMCVVMLMGCTTTKKEDITLSFKDVEFIEYGSSFDTKDFIEKTNGSIEEYPKLDTSQVGKQTLTFVVNKDQEQKSFDYDIEVKDTQKPIIEIKKDKVEIDYNGKYDALQYIQNVNDPIDGNISYKKESDIKTNDHMYFTYHSYVNIKKAGNYTIHYTAVDKNMNKTEKDVIVTVKEEKQQAKITPKKEIVTKPKESTTSTPKKTETVQETLQSQEPQQSDYTYVLPSTIAKTKSAKNAHKIVTVTSTKSSSRKGIVQYFVKSGDQWVEKMKVNAILGKAGMGKGSEHSTRTPVGTYRFTHAYGIQSNPGSRMPYTQLNEHHYWCADQYYNQFVDDTVIDHSACSIIDDEHLIDYPGSYDYFASFNYNSGNVPGVGSAYFLHCAQGNYTLGCIGVPKSNMIYLLQNIDTSTMMIIDQVNNIEKH